MKTNKVDILGTEYLVQYTTSKQEPKLEDIDGECRWYEKTIIIDNELKSKKHKNK